MKKKPKKSDAYSHAKSITFIKEDDNAIYKVMGKRGWSYSDVVRMCVSKQIRKLLN